MAYFSARFRQNAIYIWIFRFLGVLFVYTSLTIPSETTLLNTPLANTLTNEYPTWYHVLWDVALTLIVLGLLANVLKFCIAVAKEHHVSKRIITRLRRWDSQFFRAFISFEFFSSRWLIGAGVSLLLWYALISPIATSLSLHVPSYNTQPVIMVMGIFGLLLIIESISWWQKKMQKYFCIHVHLE